MGTRIQGGRCRYVTISNQPDCARDFEMWCPQFDGAIRAAHQPVVKCAYIVSLLFVTIQLRPAIKCVHELPSSGAVRTGHCALGI